MKDMLQIKNLTAKTDMEIKTVRLERAAAVKKNQNGQNKTSLKCKIEITPQIFKIKCYIFIYKYKSPNNSFSYVFFLLL